MKASGRSKKSQMKNEIIEKLGAIITAETFDEPQAVFILSRIRKYLEETESQNNFPYLNFYCNWALHPKISRRLPVPVETMLWDYFKQIDEKRLWDFDYLKDDLQKFLEFVELPTDIVSIDTKFNEFKKALLGIYLHTPVQFKLGPLKVTLTVSKSENRIKLTWGMSPASA